MTNAYVTEDHHGDNGTVREGAILMDVPAKRFEALEKAGLVRAATDDEVKAGTQHAIEPDPSKAAEVPQNKQARKPANKVA